MNIKLINELNPNYNITQQILHNRGIKDEDMLAYMNTTADAINDYNMLGEENLKAAAAALAETVKNNKSAIVVVDCDADGYTSAAILINYLYDVFPSWTENKLQWILHEGKQHGLKDTIDTILARKVSLVICPDSSSNDYDLHKRLKDLNIPIIILDHHIADHVSEDAIVINNQLSDYPNKNFSGAGIVYQFCRYLDNKLDFNYAENYIDLAAWGNCADMMATQELETKYLINEGLKEKNIKNPLMNNLAFKTAFVARQKGRADASGNYYFMGAAFYLAPLLNAITRSATMTEKELVFKAMLKFKAFEQVLSNKRGHKLGEMETILEQASRTMTNVKNRQTREEDKGVELLEQMIKRDNMLEHKVLIFLLKHGDIDPNIRGLCANKMMSKYQRPVAVLTYGEGVYAGSCRGYDRTGLADFRQLCLDAGLVDYAEGHENAFGLAIAADLVPAFQNFLDIKLSEMSAEVFYRVDKIYYGQGIDKQDIFDIEKLNPLWSSSFDEAKLAIKGLSITKDMIKLLSPDKNPTIKITIKPGLDLIKFGASEEEFNKLYSENGSIVVDIIIDKCQINEWNGFVTAQGMIEAYEIQAQNVWVF